MVKYIMTKLILGKTIMSKPTMVKLKTTKPTKE